MKKYLVVEELNEMSEIWDRKLKYEMHVNAEAERLLKLAAEREREACAEIADKLADDLAEILKGEWHEETRGFIEAQGLAANKIAKRIRDRK